MWGTVAATVCTAGVSVFTRKMKLVVCHAKNIACYAQSWQLVQSWKKNEGPTNGSTDDNASETSR